MLAGQAVLTLTDEGHGVDGDPESLFTAFETTKEKGSGFGLFLARRIAGDAGGHKGQLAVQGDAGAEKNQARVAAEEVLPTQHAAVSAGAGRSLPSICR